MRQQPYCLLAYVHVDHHCLFVPLNEGGGYFGHSVGGLSHHGNGINEFSDSLQHCGGAREVVIGPWIREINYVCVFERI